MKKKIGKLQLDRSHRPYGDLETGAWRAVKFLMEENKEIQLRL